MTSATPQICPFCDESFDNEPAFRCHLMGRHHKSEMTDFIVAALDEPDRIAIPA